MNSSTLNTQSFSPLSLTLIAILTVIVAGGVSRVEAQNEWTTTGNDISNTNSGNVGIGITTPNAKLHIVTPDTTGDAIRLQRNANNLGYGIAQYFALKNSSSTAVDYAAINGSIVSNTAGSESGYMAFFTRKAGTLTEQSRWDQNTNFGFGTTTPGQLLSVTGLTNRVTLAPASGTATMNVQSDTLAGVFLIHSGASSNQKVFQIASSSGQTQIRALNDPLNTITYNFLTMDHSNGYVGVGTTSPSAKLHVAGDLIVDGNISAPQRDLAEWVESSQVLPPGTVVVLDRTRSNQVIASSQPYDTGVAGVISSRPGIALGESGKGRFLVATTGRVKVKVDATSGPIEVGDLLVSGDKVGMARKSEPLSLGGVPVHRPGTLIGKALEPLKNGTGEILVLLSLQ